ncbi:NlpC/P60 family protein [Kribbella sp. NBC_00889]|uniref:C40 family peptidase n=1 Tax=Kribbella sp. NBC_00889 TaxID=2975974 RepID=UPI0038638699|nr:bifunctional lytic transglycosylase/C40 family peptidase [Kribbella sp. NBC_00889]
MHGGRIRHRLIGLAAVMLVAAAAGCAPPSVTQPSGVLDSIIDAALKIGTVPTTYQELVVAAGKVCPGVSAPLVAAQIEQESEWNPNAESPVGAQGLSQFMPGTWAELGRDANGNGVNSPFDPADAIDAQARYDCQLLTQVNAYLKSGRIAGDPTDLMLAAYNAGTGRVLDAGGIPSQLPVETQQYIARIRKLMTKYADVTLPTGGTGNVAAVKAAARWMGTPYVWGGGDLEHPTGLGRDGRGPGWDCSSLTRHAIWIASGRTVQIPRVSSAQATAGRPVEPKLAAMAPGDIIAFSIHGGGIDHVGIYAGNGTMIHAPRTGKNVEQVDLTDAYWSKLQWTVRRFL